MDGPVSALSLDTHAHNARNIFQTLLLSSGNLETDVSTKILTLALYESFTFSIVTDFGKVAIGAC